MPRHRTGKIKRRRSEREPKARFFLFCEGQNTEPAYFRAVREELYGDVLLKIECGVGEPRTVAEKARERIRRKSKDSFQKNDRVWAIFDRDEHQKFDEAVDIFQANGIGMARSNPCFELWLILHEREYDIPDGSRAAQRELAKLRPEYDPEGAKFRIARKWWNDCPRRKSEAGSSSIDDPGTIIILSGGPPQPWAS